MRFALFLVVLAFAAAVPGVVSAAPKDPKECPRPFSDREQITADLAAARSCTAAVDLFAACQGGASGDIEYGDIVVKRCERDFLGGLTPAKLRTYRDAHKQCGRKYAKQSGTMYRSFEAFCHAEVAQTFARRASPAR